jgi:hypothetical protein
LKSEWANRAVGRAMRDYLLRVTLLDAAGKPVASADAGPTGCHRWVKGQSYPLAQQVTLRDAAPGTYQLSVTVMDPRGGKPIALPLVDGDAEKNYRIGEVNVIR